MNSKPCLFMVKSIHGAESCVLSDNPWADCPKSTCEVYASLLVRDEILESLEKSNEKSNILSM